jgi:hypothetical protein
MVQMIYNKHLDRLQEIPFVQDFISRQGMCGKLCSEGENHSFILYRRPYAVEFYDALIENYLEISLLEPTSNYVLRASTASGICLEMGLQKIEALRQLDFRHCAQGPIFLSSDDTKMLSLYEHLDAIDKLLPLLEARGGLASMRDGTFDSQFNFSDLVQPMYPGLQERYKKCLDGFFP